MRVRLKAIDCKTDQPEVEVTLPATLGRGDRSDLVIAHPEVSRQHCRLFEYRGVVHLQDMRSLNGTFTGGQRLSQQEVQLLPGETFMVGPVKFIIDYSPNKRGSSVSRGFSARMPASGSSSAAQRISRGSSQAIHVGLNEKTLPADEMNEVHTTEGK